MAPEAGAPPASEVPAFDEVYERYFNFVWSSSRRLGVSMASLDDVVQEIFMVIHAKLDTLRQPSSLRSWIYGVVRRTVGDHHRALRTRTRSTGELAVKVAGDPPRVPTPQDLREHSEQVGLLFSLLDQMAWPKREVFMLAELEQMTVPEIAEALSIPLNTAYSRLRAARISFEELLADLNTRPRERT